MLTFCYSIPKNTTLTIFFAATHYCPFLRKRKYIMRISGMPFLTLTTSLYIQLPFHISAKMPIRLTIKMPSPHLNAPHKQPTHRFSCTIKHDTVLALRICSSSSFLVFSILIKAWQSRYGIILSPLDPLLPPIFFSCHLTQSLPKVKPRARQKLYSIFFLDATFSSRLITMIFSSSFSSSSPLRPPHHLSFIVFTIIIILITSPCYVLFLFVTCCLASDFKYACSTK